MAARTYSYQVDDKVSRRKIHEQFSVIRYTHAEEIWNFLRYDRSNRLVSENENRMQNNESHSKSSFGPIPLYKWPQSKVHQPQGQILTNRLVNEYLIFIFFAYIFIFQKDSTDHLNDKMRKKSDDKIAKKRTRSLSLNPFKDLTVIRSAIIQEKQTSNIVEA